MSHWENEFGDVFESREDAYEDSWNKMEDFELANALEYIIGFRALLEWAMQQDGFYEYFSEQIDEAENEFFSEHYYEVEDE